MPQHCLFNAFDDLNTFQLAITVCKKIKHVCIRDSERKKLSSFSLAISLVCYQDLRPSFLQRSFRIKILSLLNTNAVRYALKISVQCINVYSVQCRRLVKRGRVRRQGSERKQVVKRKEDKGTGCDVQQVGKEGWTGYEDNQKRKRMRRLGVLVD